MLKKLSEMNHDEIGDLLDAINRLVRIGLPPDATFVLTVGRTDGDQTYTTTSSSVIDLVAVQRHMDSLEEE